ncbi:MAG: YraN family protein [Clostridia bacterium]|nr:YraN family protein [Clostridia bacterium]
MKLAKKKGAKNRTGARGERYAARWLRLHGYRVVGRNVEMRSGEIDIIAKRGKYLVFCEVKTRTETPALAVYGRPALAVNREKRRHIVYAAKQYLRLYPSKKQPRFDIIEVYLDPDNKRKHRIEQLINAFGDET